MINILNYCNKEDIILHDNYRRLDETFNSSEKNILVTGGRQVGLTTTLSYLVLELLKTDNVIGILTQKLVSSKFIIDKIKNLYATTILGDSDDILKKIKIINKNNLRGVRVDYMIVDEIDYIDNLNLNELTLISKRIVAFTTPNNYMKNGLSLIKNGFEHIIFNNPLDIDKIENFINSNYPKNYDEFYFNNVLGRYYDEKQNIIVKNIKINKVLYTLMLTRMLEFEKQYGRKMTINNYIVELIKQDVMNNVLNN